MSVSPAIQSQVIDSVIQGLGVASSTIESEDAVGFSDPALDSFILLAQFLGVPAEASQIHHDRGQGDRPYTIDDLVRIAKKLELIARRKRAAPSEFAKLPLPALVTLNDGGAAILLKVDDTGDAGVRHMVLKPDSQRPEIWSEEEVAAGFALTGGQADMLLDRKSVV